MGDSYSYKETSLANRDDPIPVITIPRLEPDTPSPAESSGADSQTKRGKRETLKKEAEKLRERLHDVGAHYKTSQGSMQERLFNTILEQVLPADEPADGTLHKDRRSRQYVDRPSFSLPLMSTNFRRFNSRIGIVFVFQNCLIRLFTWVVPTHTLSFLAIYTLVCLQPMLLPVVPLAIVLFFIMVPSFLVRHPPPPASKLSSVDAALAEQYASYGYSGPAVAPPQRVKPAPEMSKDFFRNMRDLQNCMEDFSRAHDGAIALITPYTDFSDERVSSAVFLIIALLCTMVFVGSHLIPWRAVALLGGWAATCAGHPEAQELLLSARSLKQLEQQRVRVSALFNKWIDRDIAMDEPPEIREVEIFELQKRQASYAGPAGTTEEGEWEAWMFTSGPYDPMSPARIAGARPFGTQFFEEVQPPAGWRWRDKKWTLDLGSREWVEERCVTGVEVETEGERWVYEIAYPDNSAARNLSNKSAVKQEVRKSWEEGTGQGKRGEWRRRRWVRLVERKVIKVSQDD